MNRQTIPERNWANEHRGLHILVEALQKRKYLTTAEEATLKELKKRRLRAKYHVEMLGKEIDSTNVSSIEPCREL